MNAIAPKTSYDETNALAASDEAMRMRLFDQFNAFWVKAAHEGVPYDIIGTMALTASIYGLATRHGPETTATFLADMVESVRSGEFNLRRQGVLKMN